MEEALRAKLASAGEAEAAAHLGAVRLVRRARELDLVTDEIVSAVESISVLRDLAAHAIGDVTETQAMDYLTLMEALLFTLELGEGPGPWSREPVP